MKSPCNRCDARCCRQGENKNRRYAVCLEPEEVKQFPEAIPYDGEMVLPYDNTGKCKYLNHEEKCEIYERRPALCRQFECVSGYQPRGRLSFFLEDNPQVVEIIKIALDSRVD